MSAIMQGGGLIHLGPYQLMKCPVCGKRSFFNFYSSAKESVTWPSPEKTSPNQPVMNDEDVEKKRLEESKYERDRT
jgi:hypothetical protein